jgi:hypothetical protein
MRGGDVADLFVTRGFVTLDELSLVGGKMLGAPKGWTNGSCHLVIWGYNW